MTPDSSADSTRRRDPYAAMQPMARPPFGAITQPLDPKRFDGRHIYDLRYKANGQGFVPGPREARVWRPAQIWVQKLDGVGEAPARLGLVLAPRRNACRPTASGSRSWPIPRCARTRSSRRSAIRSRGCRTTPSATRHRATRRTSSSCRSRAGSRAASRRSSANESDLAWSPDGKRISFVSAPARVASQPHLHRRRRRR